MPACVLRVSGLSLSVPSAVVWSKLAEYGSIVDIRCERHGTQQVAIAAFAKPAQASTAMQRLTRKPGMLPAAPGLKLHVSLVEGLTPTGLT